MVDEIERAKNRNKSKIRAWVAHVFAVVKRLWGFAKVRYRGLDKNATRSFVALGLANIYLARTRLMAGVHPTMPTEGIARSETAPNQPKSRRKQPADRQVYRNAQSMRIGPLKLPLVQRCLKSTEFAWDMRDATRQLSACRMGVVFRKAANRYGVGRHSHVQPLPGQASDNGRMYQPCDVDRNRPSGS